MNIRLITKLIFSFLEPRCIRGYLLLALLMWGATANVSAQLEAVRLSHHWAPLHTNTTFVNDFVSRLEKRSHGELQRIVYPSGQLFSIKDTSAGISTGSVQFGGVVSSYSFGSIDSNYFVESLPYSYKSYEDMRGFLRNTPAEKSVWQSILDKLDLILIADIATGPIVTFSTNVPLDSVDSYQGLKMRGVSQTDRIRGEVLGAESISLPTEEIFMALQSGMLNAVSTVPTAVKAYNWDAYLRHAQLPPYLFSDGHILANKQWFESLPSHLQTLILEVGSEITAAATAEIMTQTEDLLDEFEEAGMTLHYLQPSEVTKLRQISTENIIPRLRNQVSPELLQAVELRIRQNLSITPKE